MAGRLEFPFFLNRTPFFSKNELRRGIPRVFAGGDGGGGAESLIRPFSDFEPLPPPDCTSADLVWDRVTTLRRFPFSFLSTTPEPRALSSLSRACGCASPSPAPSWDTATVLSPHLRSSGLDSITATVGGSSGPRSPYGRRSPPVRRRPPHFACLP